MITVTYLPNPEGLSIPEGESPPQKRAQNGAYVYEQGDSCQSEADEQGVSLSSYIHALFSLICQKRSKRVLMIGCGGGTLATLLARSGIEVTVIDNNPNAFVLARRYFHLPEQVKCAVADGADHLKDCGLLYDAVVLDAYNGNRIPRHLQSLDFLKLVKRRLHQSEGIFLANVYLHHAFDLTADKMVHAAGTIWRDVGLLDGRGYSNRNAIVLAGAIGNIEPPRLIVRPSSQALVIEHELGCLKFRGGRLGGGHPTVDRFRRLAAAQDLHGSD